MQLDVLIGPPGKTHAAAVDNPVNDVAATPKGSIFDELLAYLLGGAPTAAPAPGAPTAAGDEVAAGGGKDAARPAGGLVQPTPTWPADLTQPMVVRPDVMPDPAIATLSGPFTGPAHAAAELAGLTDGSKAIMTATKGPGPVADPLPGSPPRPSNELAQAAPGLPGRGWAPGGRPIAPTPSLAATAAPDPGQVPDQVPDLRPAGVRPGGLVEAVPAASPAAQSGSTAFAVPDGRPVPPVATPASTMPGPATSMPPAPSPRPTDGVDQPVVAARTLNLASAGTRAQPHAGAPALQPAPHAGSGTQAVPTGEVAPVGTTGHGPLPGGLPASPQLAAGVGRGPTPAAQVIRQISLPPTGARGEQRVTLQLEPEHLGRVEVRLVAQAGRLEVVLQAETSAAAQALRENLQDLVRALGGRGEGRWQQVDIRIAEPATAAREALDREHPDDERDGDHEGRQQRDGRRQDPHGGR